MPSNFDNGEVSYEILEEISVLSTYSTGWTRELNLVRWNNGPARYDIREWDPHHERMSKGLTFDEREMRILADSLRRRRSRSNRPAPSGETAQDVSSGEPAEDTASTVSETETVEATS